MRFLTRIVLTAALAIMSLPIASAQDGVELAGWPRRAAPVCPPASLPPVIPCPPGMMPAPVTPGQPATPGTAPTTPTTPTTPDLTPPTPATPAPAPALPSASNLLAEAPARGTGSGGTALPNVNGDLLGGGGIAGPLPVIVAPSGRIVGNLPVEITRNGQRRVIGAPDQVPTDELLRNRGLLRVAPEGSRVVGLFPSEGSVFDPSLADQVSRIPQVVRGPFKVGENESPRPRTRFLFSYYFYDNVFRQFGGDLVPRVEVHQQVFGYEQAFMDGLASVGIRLPYNQIVSNRFYNYTGLGDITITSKIVLLENTETGSLLSTGLLLTPPSGNRPFNSTITGDEIGGTLIQPYLGYILQRDRWYLQGFSSIVVPTDSRDVTLLTNGGQGGYILYRNPGAWVSSVVPTVELHVNTPLNHRGSRAEPVGFVDQVTALAGTQISIRERSGLGFSVGAPITGPRPFSLQATVQFNFWF